MQKAKQGVELLKMPALLVAALALAMGILAGCTSNSGGSANSDGSIDVTITDTTCEVAVSEVDAGQVTFNVTNNGSAVNEFEILAEDQLQIVFERENLTPGTTTEVTCVLEPGTYYTASKKNMVGPLVDAKEFKVNDTGQKVEVSADEQELRDTAVTNYTAYIRDQSGQLISATQEFVDAYKAGNVEKAKSLYAPARMYYERIEPTAEAFGDIDPNLDLREADAIEEGSLASWRGWHAIEKDLWGDANWDDAKKAELADNLVADTQALYDLVYADSFEVSLDDISNGAISLLEEVATSKITGEEEAFSHTDLYDFQANVEGAKVAYGNVKTLAEQKDPEVAKKIDEELEKMESLLAQYSDGNGGYKDYTELTDAQVKELADQVNALRIPLGDLTKTILS